MGTNSGVPKSAEHKAKLSISNILTRLAWSPERKKEARRKNSESHKGTGLGNKGNTSIPWNKGKNWRNGLSDDEIKKVARDRARKYRAENPRVRVDDRVSAMIRQALKEKKAGRSWEKLVGYTSEDLCKHLESLFVDGMSWENSSEWHIDHIKPRSSFRYESSDDPEFKECWKLSNLRPLWAKDNLTKGSKWQ